MSKIKAGTTSGTALVTEGDTTGQLVFQTNGTTTALTLGTDQSATFAGNVSINGSIAVPSPLAITGNSTAGAEIRLPEDTDNGSNYVALKAPNALASNLTLTLPTTDGTNGQVLQTNGAGQLSFGTAPSGMVLLGTQTVSSNTATVDFTTQITSAYDTYFVVFDGVLVETGGPVWVQLYKSGSWQTGNSRNSSRITGNGNTVTCQSEVSASNIKLFQATSGSTPVAGGYFYLGNVNTTTNRCMLNGQAGTLSATVADSSEMYSFTAFQNTAAVTTGIRFGCGGLFTAGTFKIYGLAK